MYFAGFLLAELDRGHIAALWRIINRMQVDAPNGATFGHWIAVVRLLLDGELSNQQINEDGSLVDKIRK